MSLPIRKKLLGALESEFPQNDFLASYISTKSSYGAIAKCCKGQNDEAIGDTLYWLKSAQTASLEGTVPPFCFADDLFGADILCLAWNDQYTNHRVVVCQSKYRTVQSQPEALATLVPNWIYHIKRRTAEMSLSSKLASGDLAKVWTPLRKKLETEPCVRVLIQYPVEVTVASKPIADIEKYEYTGACKTKRCRKTHDWLYTIHGGNASSFFDQASLPVINNRKGLNLDHNAGAGAKRQPVK